MRITRPAATMLFMNVGHSYSHLFMLLYPTAVLTMGDEFAGSYGELLTLSTFSFAALAIGTLPAGWLGDRWSRRGMMVAFFLGMGAGAVVVGLSEGMAGIAAGLSIIGLFSAIYHPVGVAVVAENAKKLGRAIGVNGVFGNLGVAVAAVVAGALADAFGWRAAFLVPGVVCALTGVGFALFALGEPEAPAPSIAQSVEGVARAVQFRIFAVVLLGTAASGMTYNALTVALPKVFEERLGALASSATEVGAWVFAVIALAAAGQIVVGHLIDRYSLKPVYALTMLLQVPVIALAAGASGAGMVALSFALMFLVFGETPVRDTLVARFTPAAWRARVYAVKSVLSLGMAVIAVPLVARVRDDTGDFTWVFYTLSGFAFLTLVSALFMPGARRFAGLGGPPAPAVRPTAAE